MKRTRKERAGELLERVTNGPAFISHGFGPGPIFELTTEQRKMIEKQIRDSYRLWVESWVLSELKDLIPELRK